MSLFLQDDVDLVFRSDTLRSIRKAGGTEKRSRTPECAPLLSMFLAEKLLARSAIGTTWQPLPIRLSPATALK